jgi:hypothetical protein
VETGEGVDHGGEHGHGRSVDGEGFEVVLEAFVEMGVAGEAFAEAAELVGSGEAAEDEELGGFDEGGFLGEFFDGIAAVAEDAFFAVDEGDGAGAAAGVSIGGVEGDEAGFGAEFGDIDGLLAFGSDDDGELVGFAVDGERGCLANSGLLGGRGCQRMILRLCGSFNAFPAGGRCGGVCA